MRSRTEPQRSRAGALLALLLFGGFATPSPARADDTPVAPAPDTPATPAGPAADTPELLRLAPYAGTWDVTMTRQSDQTELTAKATAEWILDGRFLRAEYRGEGVHGMLITTFDKSQRVYRRWQYDAAGTVTEFTGKWDENAGALRFDHVSEDMSHRIVVESQLDGDTETWTLIVKDRDGQELDEFKGVSRRQ